MNRIIDSIKERRYSFRGAFISIQMAILLFLSSITIGTVGYVYIEGYGFIDALYMAVITISTVGFTEVQPLSEGGRLFTAIYIITNIGIFAYTIYAFTDYIIEGEIFKKMHIRLIENKIKQLQDHIIICGFGRYGQEVSTHFSHHFTPYVVIDASAERIKEIQRSDEKTLYIQGDATHDETLIKAGIHKAKAILCALPDDTDNVFTVLIARELNANINIISRVNRQKAATKLKLAGANHTIMPEQIGGFYMANMVTKPSTVEFFAFLSKEYDTDIGFDEIHYEEVPAICQSKTIAELHIRRNTGCNVIGYRSPSSKYIINPDPSTPLIEGSSFIVIGNDQQLKALKAYWKSFKK